MKFIDSVYYANTTSTPPTVATRAEVPPIEPNGSTEFDLSTRRDSSVQSENDPSMEGTISVISAAEKVEGIPLTEERENLTAGGATTFMSPAKRWSLLVIFCLAMVCPGPYFVTKLMVCLQFIDIGLRGGRLVLVEQMTADLNIPIEQNSWIIVSCTSPNQTNNPTGVSSLNSPVLVLTLFLSIPHVLRPSSRPLLS
jgi:hypothetical protein